MHLLRFALACLATTSFACDDGGYQSPQTCQLACERAARCGGEPRRDCAASCRGPEPAPRFSKRYLDAVRRCLDAQSCSAFAGAGYEICAHDEADRLTPSKAASELCRRASDDERSCGRSLDPRTCLDDVKLFEDDDLRRAQSCFVGACVDHAACLRNTLGPYPYNPYVGL